MTHITTEFGTEFPLQTSGCQLLPGLCISLFDGEFHAQGGGVYRIQPHGEQALDVLVGHVVNWDEMQKPLPDNTLFSGIDLSLEREPGDIVRDIHQQLLNHGLPSSAGMSLLCLRVDLAQGRITWVGCGADAPIIYLQDGKQRSLDAQMPVLSAAPMTLRQDSVSMQPGDSLFLAAASGNPLDRGSLEQVMARQRSLHLTPGMALHGLRADWVASASHDDGLLLLLLQRHALGVNLDRLELPVSLDILGNVREFISLHAQKARLSEEREAGLVLAVVEVVTNVIRHARGLLADAPIEILIEHQAENLVLTIRYFGQAYQPDAFAQVYDLSTYPEGGFGHYIIQKTCDDVYYGHHAGANVVRLTISTVDVDAV